MVDGNNKANEFVKKFGWYAVKYDFSNYLKYEKVGVIQILTKKNEYIEVSGDDLKRLVENYELVLTRGGLPMARADMLFLDEYEKESPYWVKMADAIKDVESCL